MKPRLMTCMSVAALAATSFAGHVVVTGCHFEHTSIMGDVSIYPTRHGLDVDKTYWTPYATVGTSSYINEWGIVFENQAHIEEGSILSASANGDTVWDIEFVKDAPSDVVPSSILVYMQTREKGTIWASEFQDDETGYASIGTIGGPMAPPTWSKMAPNGSIQQYTTNGWFKSLNYIPVPSGNVVLVNGHYTYKVPYLNFATNVITSTCTPLYGPDTWGYSSDAHVDRIVQAKLVTAFAAPGNATAQSLNPLW